MKLNQEWKKEWEAIEVPEIKLAQLIEKTVAKPEKLTLLEKIRAAARAMKKKFRRRTWYMMTAAALVVVVGVGVYGSQRGAMKYSYDTATQEAQYVGEGMTEMEDAAPSASKSEAAGAGEADEGGEAKQETAPTAVSDKMAHFYEYSKQTTDFSADVAKLEKLIADSGSYIETSNRSKWSGELQSAYYKIRIPDKGNDSQKTLDELREIGETTDERVWTENYSAAYTDNESRIKALETEESALLELLGKSDKLEDMLKIQERLATIRSERETLVRSNKGKSRESDSLCGK